MSIKKDRYERLRKYVSIKERKEDHVEWLFEPGDMNNGKEPLDEDYIDAVIFCTKSSNPWMAVQRIVGLYNACGVAL